MNLTSYSSFGIKVAFIAAAVGVAGSCATCAQEPSARTTGHTASTEDTRDGKADLKSNGDVGNETWKTYRDEKTGYSIRYPSAAALSNGATPSSVGFTFTDSFVVDGSQIECDSWLRVEVHSIDREQSSKEWALAHLVVDADDVLEQDELQIDGHAAYRVLIWTVEDNETHIAVKKDSRVFEISHSRPDHQVLPPDLRRRYEQVFREMIQSFRIVALPGKR